MTKAARKFHVLRWQLTRRFGELPDWAETRLQEVKNQQFPVS